MMKIFALVLCLFSLHVNAFELEKEKFSVLIPFTSYHENNEIRNAVNQKNLGLGIRYHIDKDRYIQAVRVFRNSMDGKADSVGIGYDHLTFIFLENEMKLGIELNFAKYEDRRSDITYRRAVPSLTASYKYQDVTFLANIIPLKNNSVILFSIKIPFP